MNRKRLLIVGITMLLWILLESITVIHFPEALSSFSLLEFSFSSLTALLFLGIGTLAWLYARHRLVACLFFGFCLSMMVSFIVETGAVSREDLFILLGHLFSALAVLLLDLLLVLFPVNFFSLSSCNVPLRILLRLYTTGVLGYGGVTIIFILLPRSYSSLFQWSIPGFYAFCLLGALIALTSSRYALESTQQRQQWDILVIGCVFAIIPFLLFTVLPSVFFFPSQLRINSQISTIPFVLIAIALGYALLRYQFVLYDGTVRSITSSIIGGIGLSGVVYATTVLIVAIHPLQLYFIIPFLAIVCPLVWWSSAQLGRWVFRTDFSTSEQLDSIQRSFSERRAEMDEIALYLALATSNALETLEVCVFVKDKERKCYRPRPAQPMAGPHGEARNSLLTILSGASVLPSLTKPWILSTHPIVAQLATTERPLFLFEVLKKKQRFPLLDMSQASKQVTFVPIRVGNELSSVLVIGGLRDDKVYAGARFEELETIIQSYKFHLHMRLIEEDMKQNTASYRDTVTNDVHARTPPSLDAFLHDERDVLREYATTIFQQEVHPTLHAVQDTLALLSSENVTPERELHLIRRASVESHELLLLMENGLETLAIREKHAVLLLSAFALVPIVVHVLEMLEGVLKQEERRVQQTIPAFVSVLCDPFALRQILLNILRIALLCSAMGTDITLHYHVVGEKDMLSIIFELSDAEVWSELLTETIQQNERLSEMQLLLLICRRLLSSMQGHFWIEQVQGDESKCHIAIVFAQRRGTRDL